MPNVVVTETQLNSLPCLPKQENESEFACFILLWHWWEKIKVFPDKVWYLLNHNDTRNARNCMFVKWELFLEQICMLRNTYRFNALHLYKFYHIKHVSSVLININIYFNGNRMIINKELVNFKSMILYLEHCPLYLESCQFGFWSVSGIDVIC